MKILDYTIRENAQKLPSDGFPSQVDKSSTFVTKAEIDGILSQIDALKAELNKLKEVEHE